MKDICFGETSIRDAATLSDWNAMVRAFLAHGASTPTHLAAVLARDPDLALAQSVKGLFCLLLGRREMVATAADALAAAQAGRADTARERAYRDALALWIAGRPTKSIATLEMILRANPADSMAMKLSQAIRFVLGDAQGMRRSVERVLDSQGDDHPLRGFALGCHAFTLEETGDYAAAEEAGLAGLALASDDAWGLHAVAHVYDMTGQSRRGIGLIESHDGSWLGCNNFRFHVWWHKALLHLDLGQTEEVLEIYDSRMRADKTDDYRDIANAASLLMRLSLDGHDVGNRWDELADLSERRIEDACLAFADLHYLLALMGGARDGAITRLISRMATASDAGPTGDFDAILAHPGLAGARGMAAFAEGRFAESFAHLARVRPAMKGIGGSHAQRDVFDRLTIDAGIRAGRLDHAEAILAERTLLRAGTEDRFTALRREVISAARQGRSAVAAQ